MAKKGRTANEAPIVRAAIELQDALDRIERAAEKSEKLPLATRNHIVRAGEFLDGAAAGHREFAARLAELIGVVDEVRRGQNVSAETLSRCADRVSARQAEFEAFEKRFAELAETAREIGGTLAAAAGPGEAASTVGERLLGVRDRVATSAEQARLLSEDAREAGLVELEREAHAISQQLGAILAKLERSPLGG